MCNLRVDALQVSGSYTPVTFPGTKNADVFDFVCTVFRVNNDAMFTVTLSSYPFLGLFDKAVNNKHIYFSYHLFHK